MDKKLKIGVSKNKTQLFLLDSHNKVIPYQTDLKIISDCENIPVMTVTFVLQDFEKINLDE